MWSEYMYHSYEESYKLFRLIRYGCAPLYIYAKSIDQIPLMIGSNMFHKFDCIMRVIPPYDQKKPVDGEFYYQGYDEVLKNVK